MSAATNRSPACQPSHAAAALDVRFPISVNPATGFATDYLNHFNEAIMLLELLAETPECRELFLQWQPRSYSEHFAASKFSERDLAIAACQAADPYLREQLDSLADTMNEVLLATREVMRQDLSGPTAAAVADIAVRWIKPLIARAGRVIDGTAGGRQEPAPQIAIDALLAR